MALQAFTKTKASTLAKLAALPRYRHPMDLLNEPTLPFSLQKQQIQGVGTLETGNFLSQSHFKLSQSSALLRNQYRLSDDVNNRKQLATKQYGLWKNYLKSQLKKPEIKLNQVQKQHIYQAMLTAKQRNEQRLALHRFVKFGYELSQAFKVDIPLNPVIIMKLVHPHFGYLNNMPNLPQYKYTHEQLFNFIEQLNAVSIIRHKGYTLHSSELLSFVFWKVITEGKPQISAVQFVDLLKIFKFHKISAQNFKSQLKYSIKEGQLLEKQQNGVRFDLLRQIFLDRDL